LIGTWLANAFGFNAALIVGGLISLVGCGLFALENHRHTRPQQVEQIGG
jgi:hypothetical protein